VCRLATQRNPDGHNPRYWRRHPEALSSKQHAMDTRNIQSTVKQPIRQRLLAFVEQPLFTLSVGIIGGIVGLFLYSPVLAVCGVCVILAFHRAKVVNGESFWKVQIPSYVVLCSVVIVSLYGLHLVIQKKLAEAPPTQHVPTASEIADELEKRRLQNSPTAASTVLPPAPTVSKAVGDPFELEIENSGLLADSRDWVNGFWMRYRYAGGEVLVPANLTAFLRIVNKQAILNHVASYTMEMQLDGQKWATLINLETVGADIYNAYPQGLHFSLDAAFTECLRTAIREDFSQWGLDNELEKSNAAIAPRDMVRGWAMFEYPPELEHVTGRELLKLTVVDVSGASSYLIHNRQSEHQNRNALGNYLNLAHDKTTVDLSSLPRSHLPNLPRIMQP